MSDKFADSLPKISRRQALVYLASGTAAMALPGLFGSNVARAAMTGAAGSGGQMVVGFSQEPTVFNPLMPHIEVDDGLHFSLFDPLFGVDEKGNFTPALATEVPTQANGGISADGLNFHLKLRDGVKWHDGQPFTAEDVKFTLELLVDPNFRSWSRSGHELVRDITIVSPTEIKWRMEKPYSPYTSILAATFIIPKHGFANVQDKNTAPFNSAPIGTGPFKWQQRVPGDHIELTANKEYYGDGPKLDRLIYKYIPDLNVMYTQFVSGDIDIAGLQWISADHYDEAKKLPGKVVDVFQSATIENFAFNLARPQFQDPAVREALYYAIDKQTIIDALYYGLPKPTETYMPRQSAYFNASLPAHEFNLDKAKALLDKAGWKPGAGGIREKNGVKLSFTNSTTAGNHLREQMQQFMQQSFQEIGVEMKISNLPPAVMWGDYWMLSKFDSAIVGLNYLTGSDPDTATYMRSDAIPAQGGAGQNVFQYKNPEVDKLLAQGSAEFAPEQRKAAYLQIQSLVRKDMPFLTLFSFANVRGHKEGAENITPNINVRIDSWNANTWYWDKKA
ncbi:MAG: peptide ABC transporter substrate-binding protein [Pantoea sp.]|uniref:ABC transporter substrate-binding protein n=1 Tax=Pantoea phytobeneficialis TaxID=2052056 RepID=A0AAP9KQE3_9GAMM|nr:MULTISPECIES: peptide ABC transporter substrate-binding protein [Pantoea]ERK17846.1 Oligopeptide ABC transporter, periplasmic oligopeptide-binding protein OppA [Pantoea sp. AS-PWVM4]MDO6408819.1 peptide ABC transporter substrate-binding protein [Pantoea phytobeneficialis]QGR07934.1 ABC transporter substrate-binding protein [Pantoea phytobeneficialis]